MTFSIVARCERTGELGVAVSTAVPAVGAVCPYLRANVGAVSTQSWVNPYLAINVLDLLETGLSADQALAGVLGTDEARDLRQIGVVDTQGRTAVWTGVACTEWAGDRDGAGYSIQGNMLAGAATLDAMAKAYENSQGESLGERLMLALEAGQAAGGDKRGRQSAAIKVLGKEAYATLDLRVDEHANPVTELRRVLEIAKQQFVPFVLGMPTKDAPGRAPPKAVMELLLKPPAERPGATAGRFPQTDIEALARWMGAEFAPDRAQQNLAVFQGIASEIARLRQLDLTDLHPVVKFEPSFTCAVNKEEKHA